MKNYIAEFMKDNGLVEGQEFKIVGFVGTYCFKGDFLIANNKVSKEMYLLSLLRRENKIEHLPFKPKEKDDYYTYNISSNEIECWKFSFKSTLNLNDYKFGNCFKTQEQCELAIPKLKQMYEDIRKELQE